MTTQNPSFTQKSRGRTMNSDNLTENDTKNAESMKSIKKSSKLVENQKKVFTASIDPYDVPLQWWETEPVKYAISYLPVNTRLLALMDSEIVRLTDRKYMVHLTSRTTEDYQEQQRARIERRKIPPSSRIKQLLLISRETLRRSGQRKLVVH